MTREPLVYEDYIGAAVKAYWAWYHDEDGLVPPPCAEAVALLERVLLEPMPPDAQVSYYAFRYTLTRPWPYEEHDTDHEYSAPYDFRKFLYTLLHVVKEHAQ